MIGVLQRLIQLLVMGGLIFVIAKPSVLPEPTRSLAQNVHVWMMGETDSWESFQSTWKLRLEQIGSLIPWFKQLATSIPKDPPQITADGILNLFSKIVIVKPIQKFETIKDDILVIPSPSSASGTLYN